MGLSPLLSHAMMIVGRILLLSFLPAAFASILADGLTFCGSSHDIILTSINANSEVDPPSWVSLNVHFHADCRV